MWRVRGVDDYERRRWWRDAGWIWGVATAADAPGADARARDATGRRDDDDDADNWWWCVS